MELVDQKKRQKHKDKIYSKYFSLVKDVLDRGEMGSAEEMLTTYLGVVMTSAVLEKTLLDTGVDKYHLRDAAKSIRQEILFLRTIQKDGRAPEILAQLKEHVKAQRAEATSTEATSTEAKRPREKFSSQPKKKAKSRKKA